MRLEATKKILRLEMLSYHELITGIKNPTNSVFQINDLKTEFHQRFKNGLYQKCDRLCLSNRFDESLSKDIAQDTMIKGLEKITEFNIDAIWPEEKLKNKIIVWLNRIASNLFIDFLRNRNKTLELDESHEDYHFEEDIPFEFEIEDNINVSLLLQQAMDELTERERLIIYLCLEHGCLENNNHLPDEIIESLCKSLSIKKGNIRVIKYRALKKIQSKLL